MDSPQSAFAELISDVDRVGGLFLLDSEAKDRYLRSIRDVGKSNLVVRPNSVPKKAFSLFTLQPQNRFLAPLFRRIQEHGH